MKFVSRAVLVLRAKAPYVEWANGLQEPGQPMVTLAHARAAGSAFLVPSFERETEAQAFVERQAQAMFEHELGMWMDDRTTWPAARDPGTFHEWFDVEVHEIVLDLGDDEIATEELA
jgi:hypothetical protein